MFEVIMILIGMVVGAIIWLLVTSYFPGPTYYYRIDEYGDIEVYDD